MPENALSQKEGDHGLRTFLNLPGFCQFSNKVLKISIILDQAIKHEGVNITGSRILSKDGIEKGGIANGTDDQLIDLQGRPGTDEENIDPQKDEEENGGDEKKNLDLQRRFPSKSY
jgi:hypothetical protein